MPKLRNTITLHKEYAEILVESATYKHTVLVDKELLLLVDKVRVTTAGYVYTTGVPSINIAHLAMNHVSNKKTVVDHISGNTLDNRTQNLRVVTQHQNSQNKTRFSRNNTGVVGIAYRKNGKYEYYRVSLTDRRGGIIANRQGKRITKQFNITKLGREEAFQLANKYLQEMKQKLSYLV